VIMLLIVRFRDAILCRSNIELRGLSWGHAAW